MRRKQLLLSRRAFPGFPPPGPSWSRIRGDANSLPIPDPRVGGVRVRWVAAPTRLSSYISIARDGHRAANSGLTLRARI